MQALAKWHVAGLAPREYLLAIDLQSTTSMSKKAMFPAWPSDSGLPNLAYMILAGTLQVWVKMTACRC